METVDEKQTFWQFMRATFGRGLVVLVPVVITIWVLNILFSSVDGIISPLFDRLLNRHIPGLGFITMVVLIFVVGALSRNLIAIWLFKVFERILSSLPIARTIYTAMKDLIGAFTLRALCRVGNAALIARFRLFCRHRSTPVTWTFPLGHQVFRGQRQRL